MKLAEMEIVQIQEEMERLEGIISRNQQSFYEVGVALTEIRDKKLYRDVSGFATFEEYCKVKWDFSRRHAYRLIESSSVVDTVKCVQLVTPTTESQARPLTKLEPDQQVIAWQKAIDITPPGKPVTAALVSRVVKQMTKKEGAMEDALNQDARETQTKAGEDTQTVFSLKRLWHVAYKKEKTAFIEWIKEQGDL